MTVSSDTRSSPIAVLDVGGSSVKAGVVAGVEPVGDTTRTPLDHQAGTETILGRFVTAAGSVAATDRLAVAIPEPFDYPAGVSLMTHKFAALHGVSVADELARLLPHEPVVRCCNDAAAAVAGEAIAGAGAGYNRVLGITLGTGLGAAFVVDSRPTREVDGLVVGDLWSRRLDDGALADDVLSARGYVEAIASGTTTPDGFGRLLADFLAPVVWTIAADVVVVGGGGATSFDAFGPALTNGLSVPAVRAGLGEWAPIVGAAAICFG